MLGLAFNYRQREGGKLPPSRIKPALMRRHSIRVNEVVSTTLEIKITPPALTDRTTGWFPAAFSAGTNAKSMAKTPGWSKSPPGVTAVAVIVWLPIWIEITPGSALATPV